MKCRLSMLKGECPDAGSDKLTVPPMGPCLQAWAPKASWEAAEPLPQWIHQWKCPVATPLCPSALEASTLRPLRCCRRERPTAGE